MHNFKGCNFSSGRGGLDSLPCILRVEVILVVALNQVGNDPEVGTWHRVEEIKGVSDIVDTIRG